MPVVRRVERRGREEARGGGRSRQEEGERMEEMRGDREASRAGGK